MVGPAVGVLSVPCPKCRAKVGRECTTRRGWITGHHERRAAWLAAERAEVRELTETQQGPVTAA